LAGAGLPGLAWAAVAQQAVMLLFRGWSLRGMLLSAPRFATREDVRAVGGFALRVQVSSGSMLVNQQTDKVVVGVIAPGSTLGQLGIGTQLAEAGRVVGTAALAPIVNRLAALHAGANSDQLTRTFRGLHELWALVVIGGTVLGAASLYPMIGAWMGPGHHKAAELGVFLVLGYGFNLLTGTPVAYLRAVGRPNLEAQVGLLSIVVNVALTVVLGIAFGAVGVVVATMCGLIGATIWFFSRLAANDVPPVSMVRLSALCAALACGALSFGWGVLMVHLLGRWGALAPVLAGLAICFVLFLSLALGGVPTRARVSAVVSPLGS
jgi:O-antigen/teichoic acid export membrane protein